MKLKIKPFKGQHCETTATGTLLNQIGIQLSEQMLFGLGEGLGFIFWNMKTFDFPFIGGRVKPDELTQNITRNLGLELKSVETSSRKKAWKNVSEMIDGGIPVGLKLDCFHLEYFSQPINFAGHYVAMYGYDDEYAYLIDTVQQGSGVKTSLESLANARAEKGPMSSRSLSYTIAAGDKKLDLKSAVVQAASANATTYLAPPISNLYFRGIEKTAKEVVKWFENSKDIPGEFYMSAMLMEKAGTGGALFRNLYRDFLKESFALTKRPEFKQGFEDFKRIAKDWSKIARLFKEIAETQDRKYVDEAARLFRQLSVSEFEAVEKLAKIPV